MSGKAKGQLNYPQDSSDGGALWNYGANQILGTGAKFTLTKSKVSL